jgi:hypothetical protein
MIWNMRVTVTTDLPIPAQQACALAQKPALLRHVLWPWMAMVLDDDQPLPERFVAGDTLAARLSMLGVLFGWTHTLRLIAVTPTEIVTREGGGPIQGWDHRLTFVPTSEHTCRYTDSVDIGAGVLTPVIVAVAHALYRYRQWRWRTLARVLA